MASTLCASSIGVASSARPDAASAPPDAASASPDAASALSDAAFASPNAASASPETPYRSCGFPDFAGSEAASQSGSEGETHADGEEKGFAQIEFGAFALDGLRVA